MTASFHFSYVHRRAIPSARSQTGLVDEVTRAAYESILARDWDRLRPMLHPYLHWSAADGTRLRGRTKVIDRLQRAAPPVKPAAVELRDGQIYRWQEPLEAPEQ